MGNDPPMLDTAAYFIGYSFMIGGGIAVTVLLIAVIATTAGEFAIGAVLNYIYTHAKRHRP